MKKIFLIFGVIFLLASTSYATDGDISGSKADILDSSAIRISNIVVYGLPGTYWADFVWNPDTLSFELQNYGGETKPSGSTWTMDNYISDGSVRRFT
jgi:hypothetical protein